MFPVPPELTSSSMIETGLAVGDPVVIDLPHLALLAQAAPAMFISTWTTMSWQALAAGSSPVRPFSVQSIMLSGSPG